LQLLAFPVGVSVDEWRPSFGQSSTYGVGLNRLGGGPFILRNSEADNVSTDSWFRSPVSLAFMHEKPRSHSADDAGSNETG